MKNLIIGLIVILCSQPMFGQKKYKDIVPDTAKVHYVHHGIENSYIFNNDIPQNTVYINEHVTTHIIMPENIKLVDISTNSVIGNQCADNIVRIKPAGKLYNYELAGTMTVIGERHIAQLNIVYVNGPARANSIYSIDIRETKRYTNPEVMMPEGDIARLAWAIYGTSARFHNIHYKKYGIKAVINNIYAVDDFFFIDFSLYNKTRWRN